LAGEEGNAELCADGVENGTDQQGAEQTLCHSAQSVNAVALPAEFNVFSL